MQLIGSSESGQTRADNDHFFLMPYSFEVFWDTAVDNVNIIFDGMFGLHDASNRIGKKWTYLIQDYPKIQSPFIT
jgi:hypothetical protein